MPETASFDTLKAPFLYFVGMRVLAIDLGSRRVGIAISDHLGITVRPVETIRRTNDEQIISRIGELIDELGASEVVVGLPLRMDGTEGDAARLVRTFTEKLSRRISLPVFTQDERLTSYEAEQQMISRGMNRKQRHSQSDQIAATIILTDYLAARMKKP
jgi:putative Holliday junction resolvase